MTNVFVSACQIQYCDWLVLAVVSCQYYKKLIIKKYQDLTEKYNKK